MDAVLGDVIAQQSIMWSPDFMGNGHGVVTEGAFAYWPLIAPCGDSNSTFLHRSLTNPPPTSRTPPSLYTDEQVNQFVAAESLREHTFHVDPTFESTHGAGHNWVGGCMADNQMSPADPVFWLYHAFIDCIWEIMRENQMENGIDVEKDYPVDDIALGVGQETVRGSEDILTDSTQSYHYPYNPLGALRPLRNIDGLSKEYTDNFYRYAPRPTCSPDKPSCGSKYLFCETSIHKCAPKLQLGATCGPFRTYDPINDGPCMNGYCCDDGFCRSQCDSLGSVAGDLGSVVGGLGSVTGDNDKHW